MEKLKKDIGAKIIYDRCHPATNLRIYITSEQNDIKYNDLIRVLESARNLLEDEHRNAIYFKRTQVK